MMKAIAILLALCVAAPVMAHQRDPDGSRMQASEINLGKSIGDRLSPPRDSVDWRYFRLKAASEVSIEVTGNRDVRIRVQLTNATGKSVADATTSDGKGRLTQKLAPGLYYVSVSASASTDYRLSVR